MKAAHPFMFMVVHIGNTKRAMLGVTPRRCSADCIVMGSVAAELLVNRAISTAGDMARNTFMGFSPRATRNNGRTMKNCKELPSSTTNTYFPKESAMIPADS